MARGQMVGGKFAWSVSSHVGPSCPNTSEDVQLVQFGYYCAARTTIGVAKLTPEEKAIMSSVVPGAPYFGSPSDPLTLSIKAHQRVHGGTQDGRISPIAGDSGWYGTGAYLMVSLSGRMMEIYPQIYPRLDKFPNCPIAVAALCRKIFNM
jgi:hypothetical protein